MVVNSFEIQIKNFNDYDSVNYRLVLLQGIVHLNNSDCNKISGNVLCSSLGTLVTWPVYNGQFKCLAQLTPGLNEVKLTYESALKSLFINFEVHDTDQCVVPVYFIPKDHDGRFQSAQDVDNDEESAIARIGFGMLMIQSLFAEILAERNFPRKSFQLETDLFEKVPQCRLFKSTLTVDEVVKMNDEELWEEVGRELMMSDLGSEKRKFVCFISCTLWNGNKVLADPALGGGGLALLGSASLHTWPNSLAETVTSLTNEKKLEPHLLDNSCFRGTYCGAFATSLGSAAHEMGHIFNLGHTRSGLMSRGFDNAHLLFIQVSDEEDSRGDELVPCLIEGRKVLKPTTIQQIRPQEAHLTFLEPGCAGILAYHCWFNPKSQAVPIRYNKLRHIVESEGASLKVVQVRGERGAVRRSWELRGSGKQLVVPSGHEGATLVAINSTGTILVEVL
ncbi:uncharacterized protein [Halyomorpha halys]|uniref:uncharacterized protein n=1 Tax=Halyomorpha halys TaxID=286706 RepID=UPI0006D513EA|nr:uncharacterized protein LOC106680819 [Halyomorpha halys]